MRLMRIGAPGSERPAVAVADDEYVDVSDVVRDFDSEFFGTGGIDRLRAVDPVRTMRRQRLGDQRVGAPIARPHQVLCIGLNYRDHAEETGQRVPTEPILFTKPPNTVVGPRDDVEIPRASERTDYEVELGVVIGTRTYCLDDVAEAEGRIAGYVAVNDVSEREFQLERGGQWSKGKSSPTFNPCGPYLVTPDEIADPNDLAMWLDVNGERRQDGSTATMAFDPLFLIHHLSQFMVLEPGDLINTGTPPGVGMAMSPPCYLNAGDVVELGIAGLGTQRQRLVEFGTVSR